VLSAGWFCFRRDIISSI